MTYQDPSPRLHFYLGVGAVLAGSRKRMLSRWRSNALEGCPELRSTRLASRRKNGLPTMNWPQRVEPTDCSSMARSEGERSA